VNEPCVWTEPDERGNHEVCREPAFFSVPVEWATDEGTQTGRVALCTTHALQATREHIAK